MKTYKANANKIIIALVIAILVGLVLPYLGIFLYIYKDVKKGQQRQECLLCQTDYQDLLEACRELSRRVKTGELKPQQYNIRLDPHPESSSFPQIILSLEPTYLIINTDGRIMIELHGGFLHYGVMAYPEDFKEPFSGYEYGDKKLIDGLWYYDEDYEDSPKIQKRIEALIENGKDKNK